MAVTEAHRLKRLVAERLLELDPGTPWVKELLEKGLSVSDKREAVQFLVGGGLSVARVCALLHLHRSTFLYATHPRDDTPLVARIHSLATQNPHYGYRRMHALLNQAERVNHERVKRLWRKHRLQIPRVVRNRLRRERPARLQAAYPGHIWAYDFVEDALSDGRKLSILTVMNEFTREGLALDVALSTSAAHVIGVLTALVAQHGAPGHLRSDNGTGDYNKGLKSGNATFRVNTAGRVFANGGYATSGADLAEHVLTSD
jgi:putative transposase